MSIFTFQYKAFLCIKKLLSLPFLPQTKLHSMEYFYFSPWFLHKPPQLAEHSNYNWTLSSCSLRLHINHLLPFPPSTSFRKLWWLLFSTFSGWEKRGKEKLHPEPQTFTLEHNYVAHWASNFLKHTLFFFFFPKSQLLSAQKLTSRYLEAICQFWEGGDSSLGPGWKKGYSTTWKC